MPSHQNLIYIVLAVGAAMVIAMFLVGGRSTADGRSIRSILYTIWGSGVPAWFSFEAWYAPTDPSALAIFQNNQKFAGIALAFVTLALGVAFNLPRVEQNG